MSVGVRRRKAASCEGIACEHTLGQQPLELYGYLWKKLAVAVTTSDSTSHNSSTSSDKFSFVLPDTVVFKAQKPVMWLFTSLQDKGVILRKTKKNLSVNVVLQEFQTPKTAQQHSGQADDDQVLASYAYLERSSASREPRLFVEHLNRAGLEELLLDREKPPLSVLQRYVPTRSGYNHCYMSVYTLEDCVVRKCTNPHPAHDAKVSLPDRTATFEAGEQLIRQRVVNDQELKRSLEQINGEISAHLEKIVGRECVRLESYFKIGANRRVYLLWSSVISFESAGKPTAKQFRLALPSALMAQFHIKGSAPDAQQPDSRLASQLKACPNCKRPLPRTEIDFLVSYKSVINSHNTLTTDEGEKAVVPALLLAIDGPTSADKFNELKTQTSYLYRTLKLCQSCAAHINTSGQPAHRAPAPPSTTDKSQAKATTTKEPLAPNANALFWARAERERKLRACPKPVVVVTRAPPPGRSRVLFSKANMKHGSTPYRRYLSQVLPRIAPPEPARQENASDPTTLMESVRNIAYSLKRRFGRPSFRFALGQMNACLLNGPIVMVAALQSVCGSELLAPVVQHWQNVCSPAWITGSVDVDELDAILAESIRVRPREDRVDQGAAGCNDQEEEVHSTDAGWAQGTGDGSCQVLIARPPQRPKSAAPTIPSTRPQRRLSVSTDSQQTVDPVTAVPVLLSTSQVVRRPSCAFRWIPGGDGDPVRTERAVNFTPSLQFSRKQSADDSESNQRDEACPDTGNRAELDPQTTTTTTSTDAAAPHCNQETASLL